jgi:hypothetical protein
MVQKRYQFLRGNAWEARGGINAASSQKRPGEPGLQENEISLFSIYPDLSGFYWREKKLLFVWTVWTLWTR